MKLFVATITKVDDEDTQYLRSFVTISSVFKTMKKAKEYVVDKFVDFIMDQLDELGLTGFDDLKPASYDEFVDFIIKQMDELKFYGLDDFKLTGNAEEDKQIIKKIVTDNIFRTTHSKKFQTLYEKFIHGEFVMNKIEYKIVEHRL